MRRKEFEEYEKPPELTTLGYKLSYFKQFTMTAAIDPDNPRLDDNRAKFRFETANPGHLGEYYEPDQLERARWLDVARYLPWGMLAKAFTFDELLKHWWSDVVTSTISDELENNPAYMFFSKLSNSMWHWGTKKDWNTYVKFFYAATNLDIGLPGFEVYLDFASGFNVFGRSQFARKFCDGALCYHLVRDGKHALTIGWSASHAGVLISQVQLAEPRGNRWLYKLQEHYLDYFLKVMHANFNGLPLWLVTGESIASHVLRTYCDSPKKPSQDVLDRIVGFYNRDLASFQRSGRSYSFNGQVFSLLSEAC